MSNSNLEKEINEYSEFNKQIIVTISKLSQFFKTFSQQGKKFIKSSLKSFEEFYSELSKENQSSTFYITYNYFVLNYKKFLEILEYSFDSFEKKIAYAIEQYESIFKNSYGEVINQFNDLLNNISEKKESLEEKKYKYFEACKSSLDIENKIIQLKDKEENIKEVNKLNEQFSISFKAIEYTESLYKNEITKINNLYLENEENYSLIIKKLRDINIDKIHFFSKILKYIYDETNQFITRQNEPILKLEKISENIKVNRDIILYDEKFNYYNDNKKRFILEQFLDFRKLKNNSNRENSKSNLLESSNLKISNLFGLFGYTNSSSNENNKNFENENNKKDEILKKEIIYKVLNLGKNDSNFIKNDDEANADSLFLKQLLFKKEKTNLNDYKNIINKLKINENNLLRFMYVLITFYKSNKIIRIENYDNLIYLSNILDYILDYCKNNQRLFDICFMIIFVAEKSIYFTEKSKYIKHYLCKILSKNSAFQDSLFWENLIDKNIKMITDKNVKQTIEKKEKETDRTTNIMYGIKNIFYKSKLENKKLENEIMERQLYEEKLSLYSVEILQDYIQHFFNFKFDHEKSIELMNNFSTKYKLDKKYFQYFLAQLNSNFFSLKNKDSTIEDNVKNIDYDKLFFNTDNRKFKKIKDNKIRCLIYSLKFIEIKELPNLLCLNKAYNNSLMKIVYKNILIKYSDMDIKTHLFIWKIILGYSKVKKEYNYQKILKEIENNNRIPSSELINLDVNRTSFVKDKEINREKISRILKSLSKCCPNVKYSQGMNFIAAFLLNISGNEEDAFFLFLSLLLTSDYGSLFTDDLYNLKKYFYVFERIIDILLPELYNFFNVNNIKVNFFASPWFITLFTDTYLNIQHRENPKVLLRIWDLFLFSGCKSILKVGISILKNYEPKIMSLTFEELVKFLIREIPKSEFFQNKSYDNLMKTYINFKIESNLINSIESEYKFKKQIDNI